MKCIIVFIILSMVIEGIYSFKIKSLKTRSFFITTVPGLESVLLNEIKQIGLNFDLGITNIQKGRAGVHFDTENESTPIQLTLWLRSSLKVMEKVCFGKNIIRKRDLYDLVNSFDWTKVIDDSHTIKCDCIIGDSISNELNNSHFTSLTVKNAIVDQIRESNGGTRPSVSVDDPDLVALVYIHKDEATCYRVWSGEQSMHKRGYRQDTIHKAALRETTAAAMLLASGFNADQVLVDPMAGSGTILLEASLMLSNTAPGLLYYGHSNAEISPDFAPPRYMTWLDNCNNIELWDEIWTKTNSLDRRKELNEIGKPLLFGNDIHYGAIELATSSSKRLGVSNIISWSNQDISSFKQVRKTSSIITNPPWNLRLNEGAAESWLKLASFVNNVDCDNIWTLTGNPELVISLKQQGLQPISQLAFSASGTQMRFIRYNKISNP